MAYDLRYGDCFKLLNEIPDKSIDLILTDPPYNIAKYSTGNIDLPGRSALNNDLAEIVVHFECGRTRFREIKKLKLEEN